MIRSTRSILALVALSLATVLGTSGAAGGAPGAWSVVPSANAGTHANGLAAISVRSASDAWAVGSHQEIPQGQAPIGQTLVERWNGTSWSVVPTPNVGAGENDLNDVVAISASNAWAVGTFFDQQALLWKTLVLHWNGTAWSVVASPSPSSRYNALQGVAATGANDVWAVGIQQTSGSNIQNHTLALHWNGTAWSVVPTPNVGSGSSYLNDVAVRSATDVWAVGSSGAKSLVERWNGTAWTVVKSPSPNGVSNSLDDVAVISATDAWAVGAGYPTSGSLRTFAVRWNGTAWKRVATPNQGTGNNQLSGVAPLSSSDVYAVGSFYDGDSTTLIERWNGTVWSVVSSPAPGSESLLLGADTIGSSTVWAVGGQGEPDRTLIVRTTTG